jgi:ribosomal protein L11 methyltransferase
MAAYPALDVRFAPGPGAGALQDQLYAELDAFEPLAIQEHEAGDGWLVFFRLAAQRNAAADALRFALGANVLDLQPVDVPDEDWARRSQAQLRAVTVGRITVAPPWDVARTPSAERRTPNAERRAPSADAITIVIDPSMGFGTGHHTTTRLCLALLQSIALAGVRTIDVGTGSGVLAIAAARLGAADAVALDHDADALQNARENVARNLGPDGAVHVMEADLATVSLPPATVVTANLTGAVLQKYAGPLRALVAPGGALIVSGFSPDELPEVVGALGGTLERRLDEGEWAAALMRE